MGDIAGVVNSILDFLLGWVLLLPPFIGIMVISLIISVITTIAMKTLTDQTLMKDMKNELKELRKTLKNLQDHPKKLAKTNEKFMETNAKYMSHALRPTLFTFIPLILIFGWLNSNMGYYPLAPNEPFKVSLEFEKDEAIDAIVTLTTSPDVVIKDESNKTVLTERVDWIIEATEGEHTLFFKLENKNTYSDFEKQILVSNERKYSSVETNLRKGALFFSNSDNGANKIIVHNEKIMYFKGIPVIENIPWIGDFGWLGAYFIFSIIFSMSLRRLFSVY